MAKNIKRAPNTRVRRTPEQLKEFAQSITKYMRRNRATWEMAAEHYGYAVKTLQDFVRDHAFARKGDHDNFKEAVKEFTRLRQEKDGLIDTPAKDVIITETGYLMKVGLDAILAQGMDIIIPKFCESELENLSPRFSSAGKVLSQLRANCADNGPITLLKLEENILFEEVSTPMKRRSEGIVAVCCDVYAESPGNRKIHLLTSSYEVSELAKVQGFGSNLDITLYKKS